MVSLVQDRSGLIGKKIFAGTATQCPTLPAVKEKKVLSSVRFDRGTLSSSFRLEKQHLHYCHQLRCAVPRFVFWSGELASQRRHSSPNQKVRSLRIPTNTISRFLAVTLEKCLGHDGRGGEKERKIRIFPLLATSSKFPKFRFETTCALNRSPLDSLKWQHKVESNNE